MKNFDSLYPGATAMLKNYASIVGQLQGSTVQQAVRSMRTALGDPAIASIQQQYAEQQSIQPYIESALSIQQQIEAIYGPLQNVTKSITAMTAEWSVALQATKVLQAIPHYDVGQLSQIAKAVQTHFDDIQPLISDVSEEELQEYCKKEEITPETVAEDIETICAEASQENVTIPDCLDKIKRTNWFFALTVIWMILSFLGKPAIDHLKDDALQAIGITQMWEDSGIYEWMDQLFDTVESGGAVSEDEAKAAIDIPTGNIAKTKREDLLGKIGTIRAYIAAAPQDENTGNLMTYLSELEKELGAKKYGLIFEEHREAIDGVLEEYTPVLTEDKPRFIDYGGKVNFLLEGDNLAALELLKKTHLGRIDLIYIDPPYNTGNKDFVFNDSFVDSQDTFRHSKWLSFMNRRLKLAKELLSDDGVIFISIDDRECAGLKLLCDEIFDESCFAANISWQRTYSKRNDSKGIPSEVEHLLVYSKKIGWIPYRLPRTAEMNEGYGSQDGDPRDWSSVTVNAPGAATHQGMVYAIQHPITGEYIYPPKGRCWSFGQPQMFSYMSEWAEYELKPIDDYEKRCELCGRQQGVPTSINALLLKEPFEIAQKKAMERYELGVKKECPWPLLYFTGNGKGGIRRKQYLDASAGRVATNLWMHAEVGHTGEAATELSGIFGGDVQFDTPKPIRLLDRIITIASVSDSSILDFFAGSGTTGHAVMAYNASHEDSHRKFILCTNNENGICEKVTYERLKRVMERDGYKASLKYQRIEYVPISERVYYEYADELLRHVRELVELENGINFTGNAEIAIVLTDEELEAFLERPDDFAKCRSLYLGHDILPTGEQVEQLQTHGVQVHVIPDYYYRELEG